MIRVNSFLVLAALLSRLAGTASAIELQGATLDAWQEYVRGTSARLQARVNAKEPFLWIDESADRAQRTRRGEIVVAPVGSAPSLFPTLASRVCWPSFTTTTSTARSTNQ